MRVVSYNLRNNSASGELGAIADSRDVDIFCVQEADTTQLPHTLGHLTLSHATTENRLGLALYYRKERFTVEDSTTFALKKSMHDRVMSPGTQRLLGARLRDAETDRSFVAASFHAAPLTASNSLRRTQITAAHEELQRIGEDLPIIMVGDFNYPLFQNKLRAGIKDSGYELSLSDSVTYLRYKWVRGHFDFVTSNGFRIDTVKTLPQGDSDHLPILVTAEYDMASLAGE
ncbi:endonuclease/exonuclease/phosphatase family protein [Agreia sp. COWG]|uniref:endonuclease/exonuclease/phosphatase family protein n=1 Tax=Agreia sp. COWG TaxID=2773266 RepID=UPI0019273F63|nr:endonuclease/exonuclease/phosphatase family protein [Agreia sp. COWG]CAD5991073.1 Exonuclease [Agreia sp. COWG]